MPDAPQMPGMGGAPEAPGAGQSQGQPPSGASPATQPLPNKGYEAAGLARLSLIVKQLENLIPMVGVGTEMGRDALKALSSLSKHVPPGSVSPGLQHTESQKLQMQNRQNAALIAQRNAAAQQAPAQNMVAPQPPAAAAA